MLHNMKGTGGSYEERAGCARLKDEHIARTSQHRLTRDPHLGPTTGIEVDLGHPPMEMGHIDAFVGIPHGHRLMPDPETAKPPRAQGTFNSVRVAPVGPSSLYRMQVSQGSIVRAADSRPASSKPEESSSPDASII